MPVENVRPRYGTHDALSSERIEWRGLSRQKFDDDVEGEPQVGKCEPREDE